MPGSLSEETSPLIAGTTAPDDKYGIAWIIFSILGVGVLFPWNCFLTAYDFFTSLYPNFPFEIALSAAYNYPSVVFLFLSMKFAPRFSFGSRILSVFVIDLLVLVSVPIVTHLISNKVSIWVILAEVFMTGCVTAILFGSVLGLASLFPAKYIGAVMSGNGVAGLITAVLRIVTKVSLPNNAHGTTVSSTIYFGLAAFVMLICIISYFILMRLPITIYYLAQETKRKDALKLQTNSDFEEISLQEKPKIIPIFKKLWTQALNVFLVFFVTLSLFPGITSLIQARDKHLNEWFQIILITLFMIFDLTGRTLPKWIRLFSPKILWIPVTIRLSFFVLFIFCIKPDYFRSDYAAYIIMALFALTNGYLGTLSMMYGPDKVEPYEKETAGGMMSFFLNFGIFVSVHFSILLLYAVTGSLKSLGV